MSIATDLKNLGEDIITSFKHRIKENEELLDGFRKDHQAMSVELRKDLANGEVERLKEFAPLMPGIRKEISEIFTFTHDLRAKFVKEIQAMSVEVYDLLAKFDKEHQAMSVGLHDLLANFDKEHQAMSVELRKDLANGEVERLMEFNVVMKGIQNDVKNLRNAVQVEMGEASAAWKKMSDIMAQLRNTAVAPPKQAVRKAEKKEVKMEIPVKAEKETPVKAVKEAPVEIVKETPVKAEPKPVVPMTLEEKILDFINKHPKGARISEMEKPLGETRMKLGYVSKKLLEDDKVLKVENVYYPKPKIKE